MTDTAVFLILVAGIGLGALVGGLLSSRDLVSRFGWAAAGAMPGAALLVGEPSFMWALAAVVPALVWRGFSVRRRTSA